MVGSLFTKLFWASLIDRTKLSVIGVWRVLSKWRYILIAVAVSILFAILFSILSVGTTEWQLLLSKLPFMEKMGIIGEALIRFVRDATTTTGLLSIVVVILQGITISLLVFSIVRERETKQKYGKTANRFGESLIASIVATLGLGCSTCGASLIIPLLSLISASAIFIGAMTTIIIVVAMALLMYSSWKMGYAAYAYTSAENLSDNKEDYNE